MTTGLMPKIAPQALKTYSPLEPDWLAKAAAKKLPHRGRAASAAFDRQAALRIPYIVRAEGRNESGKTNTKILAEDGQRLRPMSFLKDAKSSSATFGRHRINISLRLSRYTHHRTADKKERPPSGGLYHFDHNYDCRDDDGQQDHHHAEKKP